MTTSAFSDEAQEAEAIQMLHAILDLQKNNDSYGDDNMIILYHTLALLHFHLMNYKKVTSVNFSDHNNKWNF